MARLVSGGWWLSVLTGAFVFVFIGRLDEPHPVVQVAILGGLYALAVHGLMQLFGLRGWGWVLAGLICGPVPASILSRPPVDGSEDRAGMLLASLLLGVLLGLVQWARDSRRESEERDRGPANGSPD